MKLTEDFLTINDYSRPGSWIKEVKAIVMHWTDNLSATAKQNRDFFETRKTGMAGYGSAHYIIDNKEIIQAIPLSEVAYHCGSGKLDPVSHKVYTDYAREKFGKYAEDYNYNSPNFCTIGIELCNTDNEGHFAENTINQAIELCTMLCKKYNLSSEDITTHHAIVGWKNCPKLWVENPALFEAFKQSVKDNLQRG